MGNININIDLSSFGRALEAIVARAGHLSPVDILYVVCSIFVPPLAVLLKVGFSVHFWINIVLTILGWIPGVIHALYVVLFL